MELSIGRARRSLVEIGPVTTLCGLLISDSLFQPSSLSLYNQDLVWFATQPNPVTLHTPA